MNNTISEYNKNYYQKHKQDIIKRHFEYYHAKKEIINQRNKEYYVNYYIQNRENIIKKTSEYYQKNKEYINNRNKEYFVNYYQKNKSRILTRVQNNYYLKVGRLKKPDRIILDPSGSIKSSTLKNVILENNIVISLMD